MCGSLSWVGYSVVGVEWGGRLTWVSESESGSCADVVLGCLCPKGGDLFGLFECAKSRCPADILSPPAGQAVGRVGVAGSLSVWRLVHDIDSPGSGALQLERESIINPPEAGPVKGSHGAR